MLEKVESVISKIEEGLILFLILSALGLVFLNVVLRYGFNTGFVFAEEFARYALVLLVYLSVSQAIKRDAMIKVDILLNLSSRTRFIIKLFSEVMSFAMGAVLLIYGLQFTIYQSGTNQDSIAMEIPMYIFFSFVPLGGLLMCFRYALSIKETLSSKTNR